MRAPSQEPATLHLGKSGVTAAWLDELREQVARRKRVKVRLLASATPGATPREAAKGLAARAGVDLVEVRGRTAVFAEPPRRRGDARHKRDPGTVI